MSRRSILASAMAVVAVATSTLLGGVVVAAPAHSPAPNPRPSAGPSTPPAGDPARSAIDLPVDAVEPHGLIDVDGILFFWAGPRGEPTRLWSTDGTTSGTTAIDVCRTALVCGVQHRFTYTAKVAHSLFFLTGEGAWRSDGTSTGTRMIVPRTERWYRVAGPHGLRARCAIASSSTHVFVVTSEDCGDPYPQQLAAIDVRAGTVRRLPVLGDSEMVAQVAPAGRRLVLFAYGEEGMRAWSTDGTPDGTRPLRGTLPSIRLTAAVRGRLFVVADAGTGQGLWVIDRGGTRARSAGAGWPARGGEEPIAMSALGDVAIIATLDPRRCDLALWRSDGTRRGTLRLTTLREGAMRTEDTDCEGPAIEAMVAGGLQYVVIHDQERGDQLWRTDGTTDGTRLVHEVTPSDGRRPSIRPAAVGTALYFGVVGEDTPDTLWRTDGSEIGTQQLAEFPDGLGEMEASGTRLYVTAADASGATRLWAIDSMGGTPGEPPGVASPAPPAPTRRPGRTPDADVATLVPDGLTLRRTSVVTLTGSQWVERYDPAHPASAVALAELQRFLDRVEITVDDLRVAGAVYVRRRNVVATVTAIQVRGAGQAMLAEAVMPFIFAGLVTPIQVQLDVDGRRVIAVTDAELGGNYRQYVHASGDVVWVIDAPVEHLTEIIRALP